MAIVNSKGDVNLAGRVGLPINAPIVVPPIELDKVGTYALWTHTRDALAVQDNLIVTADKWIAGWTFVYADDATRANALEIRQLSQYFFDNVISSFAVLVGHRDYASVREDSLEYRSVPNNPVNSLGVSITYRGRSQPLPIDD
jgi:hypothetical protein